jgi:hypothetical protein
LLHINETYTCPSIEAPKIAKDKSPSKLKKSTTDVQKSDVDDQEENSDSDNSNLIPDQSNISNISTKHKSGQIPDSVLPSIDIHSTEYSIQNRLDDTSSPYKQQEQLLLTGPPSTNIPVNTDPQIECISCSEIGADTKCQICGNNIHSKCSVVESADICSDPCKEKLES